jgi:glycerol 2-dehydrogenase (NADP+)
MWGIQRGNSVIPKSVTASRIEENFDLDGWKLTDEEMDILGGLDVRLKACRDVWLPVNVFNDDED